MYGMYARATVFALSVLTVCPYTPLRKRKHDRRVRTSSYSCLQPIKGLRLRCRSLLRPHHYLQSLLPFLWAFVQPFRMRLSSRRWFEMSQFLGHGREWGDQIICALFQPWCIRCRESVFYAPSPQERGIVVASMGRINDRMQAESNTTENKGQ